MKESQDESLEGFENEAVVSYPRIVEADGKKFHGLACHVCGNKDSRCLMCGGPGTPWLI